MERNVGFVVGITVGSVIVLSTTATLYYIGEARRYAILQNIVGVFTGPSRGQRIADEQ